MYTSEDDFEDSEMMPGVWCQENPLINESRIPEAEEEDEYYGEEHGGEKTKQLQAAFPSYLRTTVKNKKDDKSLKCENGHPPVYRTDNPEKLNMVCKVCYKVVKCENGYWRCKDDGEKCESNWCDACYKNLD